MTHWLRTRVHRIVTSLACVCMLAGCGGSPPTSEATTDTTRDVAVVQHYIKASNTGANDRFGTVAVSADGNTLAVGAIRERSNATGIDGDQTDNSAIESGAVYVYVRNGNTWVQQAYVKAGNTDAFDRFGTAVALSGDGNTLVVGAPRESSNATGVNGDPTDNSAVQSGAVYVFTRNAGVWSQQAYLKASNTEGGDSFGIQIALAADGNTLAVGASNEFSSAVGVNGNQADNAAAGSGAVYVFTQSGTGVWSQQAYVKASNTGIGDGFGSALALSHDGNTMAVSSPLEESNATGINGNQADNTLQIAGAVYVFTRSAGAWSQQAYVKASNTSRNQTFGLGVALSAGGDTMAVGAQREGSNATGINGNQADTSATESGAVYVYTRSGAAWQQQAYVKTSNAETLDYFGIQVALSADGNLLAASAFLEASAAVGVNGDQADNSASRAGAAYVFARTGSTWQQAAYVKASNTNASDIFGGHLALSADGRVMAVGAVNESSNATGVNGNQTDNSALESGAVYLYEAR